MFTEDEEKKINLILTEAKGIPSEEISPLLKEEFFKKFSFGSLIYNTVYYGYMKDRLFFWLSILSSLFVFTLPGLVILSFMARRRAWQSRSWDNFAEFQENQHKWDRAGWYGLVFFVVGIYFIGQILWNQLSVITEQSGFTGSTSQSSAKTIKQLKQTVQDLQQGN